MNGRRTATRYLVLTGLWLLWGLFNASRMRAVVPEITWSQALLYGVPDGLLWALLTPIPVAVARRFPLPSDRPVRNTAVHLVVGSIVAVLHTQLDVLQNALRLLLTDGEPILRNLSLNLLAYAFHLNLLVYLFIAGVAMYLGRLASEREGERRAARLRERLAEARLEALRAQIRPHFLFNALHTVGAVVERDPVAGRRVLRQLGELLRASLSPRGDHEIPLRREIELTRSYLEIERTRFGDRLSLELEVDERAAECGFPALLLQPLAENAVRHGIARSAAPGHVRVEARRVDGQVEVTVCNSVPHSATPTEGNGIGLAGVRERLRTHYGDAATLLLAPGSEFVVTLRVPYRRLLSEEVAVLPDRRAS